CLAARGFVSPVAASPSGDWLGAGRRGLLSGLPKGLFLAKRLFLKGLILAQNERWRRGLGMQVERIPKGLLLGGSGERGSKAWVTYPLDEDSQPNGWVILGDVAEAQGTATNWSAAVGAAHVVLP